MRASYLCGLPSEYVDCALAATPVGDRVARMAGRTKIVGALRVTCASAVLLTALSTLPASAQTPTPDAASAPGAARSLPPPTVATHSAAPGSPPVTAPRSEVERRWYGWQTLIADGLSIGLAPVGVGVVGYFLGAPIVHWAHGNVDEGFGSLAIRGGSALLILAGAICVFSSRKDTRPDECVAPIVLGVGGIIAAIPIDAAVLAYDEVERDPDHATIRFTPIVDPRRQMVGLTAFGTF